MRAKLLIFFLMLISSAVFGFELEHSVVAEYNYYRNNFPMKHGYAFGYRVISDQPPIRVGVQFMFSRLPYLGGNNSFRLYRDQITWYGIFIVKDFLFFHRSLGVTPGIGYVIQSTWHDDLEDGVCGFGCGDYSTRELNYFVPQISSEIRLKLLKRTLWLSLGISGKYFVALNYRRLLDIHDPPPLGFGWGPLLRISFTKQIGG